MGYQHDLDSLHRLTPPTSPISFALNDLRIECTPLTLERRLQAFTTVYARRTAGRFSSNEYPRESERRDMSLNIFAAGACAAPGWILL
jgi:hypothetical protein